MRPNNQLQSFSAAISIRFKENLTEQLALKIEFLPTEIEPI